MARGGPDYGGHSRKTVGGTLEDMADLAVRLGSIVEYDRRGDIVVLDGFEAPVLSWTDNVAPAPAAIRHDSTNVKSGAQALQVITGNVAAQEKRAIKSISLIGALRLGIEASFANPTANCSVVLRIRRYDGTTMQEAAVRYNPATSSLYIYDSTPAWVLVAAGIATFAVAHLFYTLKLVADLVNNRYVRLLFADIEYNISATAINTAPSAVSPRVEFILALLVNVATGDTVWYDNFVGTQNEP